MQYIDEKFKDMSPADTVAKIQGILNDLGVEVFEKWNDSGVEHCYSLTLSGKGGVPSSNGKGITKEFARASAYGEFIERLQGGLHLYKYQSIGRDSDMYLQSFAPDVKYMTVEELIENGEWMDTIVETYNNPAITRESIAELCRVYACSDDGKILTVPFYSVFEKKHVYLPMHFVDQIYATNGCCVGNTREEAWVHALSEMMERHASLNMLTSGKSAPKIPDEVINQFPVVSKIINDIRKSGDFDIDIFDYSIGNGFPVVSTRIINKKTQVYRVNVAADPVFEIALQRTLTELMQGKNINNFTAGHGGKILSKLSDFPKTSNVINQLETGNGVYTADFFANELTCDRESTQFADKSTKNNKELLEYLLGLYRDLDKPVYVRNFSYLGFPCYRFVVPGFSEAMAVRLYEPIPEYAIAEEASKVYKNPKSADIIGHNWLLNHTKMISTVYGRYMQFGRISGIPFSNGKDSALLICATRAYCAYMLGQYSDAAKYMDSYLKSAVADEEIKGYFACVNKYLELVNLKVDNAKICVVLKKFFLERYVTALFDALDNGKTPYDDYLLECDPISGANCDSCRYKEACSYAHAKDVYRRAGEVYKTFTHGQDFSEFEL